MSTKVPVRLNQNSNWSVVYLILGAAIIWFVSIHLLYGFTEASIRMNIRWTARFSIICFCMAFGASSINTIFKNKLSKWLVQNRKYLGVSFALIHLIHLLYLILLHYYFYQVFIERPLIVVALGGLAYLFIVLMLLTSFETFSRLISRSTWQRLHTIGGYWILIVFSNSMLGRVIAGQIEYLPFGILVIFIWLSRILTLRKGRSLKNV